MTYVIDCGGRPDCGRCKRCRRIKPDHDATKRLLAEQAGPPISWGPPASLADARRRKAKERLEKAGLRPRRW